MATYPGAAAGDSQLYIAVNATSTQLTDNPLTSGATTVNVIDASAFPSVGFISIDNEIIAYTGKTGTSFTGCTRASDGTSAASHVQNSQVFHNVIAKHHNTLKDEIAAIESDLVGVQAALTPTTPTSTATSILNRVNQIVQRFKDFAGLTNWYDAFTSFPVSKGGTGNTTLTSGAYLKGAGTSAITTQAAPIPVADGGTNSTTALSNGKIITSSGGAIVEAGADASMNSHKITSLSNGTASSDAAAFGQIQVLQVVFATTTTTTNTTSSTFTDTSLTASITPTSSSNRVLVMAFGTLEVDAANKAADATIKRGSTNLMGSRGGAEVLNAAGAVVSPCSLMYVDSPATTSSTTYTVQIRSEDNATNCKWGDTGLNTTIVLVEIV